MTALGYARVGTIEQNRDGQHDALAAAGCDRVFADASRSSAGARNSTRCSTTPARATSS
jgi:DNA invertase Pin-like site-specific DNA recombinase